MTFTMLSSINQFLGNVYNFLGTSGSIGTVLMILWTIAKRVSNDKAGPVVAKIQAGFDFVAGILGAIGKAIASLVGILQKCSGYLASLVQSDGVLGVK